MTIAKRSKPSPLLEESFYKPGDGTLIIQIEQHEVLEDGRWYVLKGYSPSGAMMGCHTSHGETTRVLKTLLGPGDLIVIDEVWYWSTFDTRHRAVEEYERQKRKRDILRSPVVCHCRCGCEIRQKDLDSYQKKHGNKEATDESDENPARPAALPADPGGR